MTNKEAFLDTAEYVFNRQCCICPPLERKSKRAYKKFVNYFKPDNEQLTKRWYDLHSNEYDPPLARTIALLFMAEMED